MWRYWAGGGAILATGIAGWLLLTGTPGRSVSLLPAQPAASGRAQQAAEPLPDAPEASAATREQKRFSRYDKDRDGHVTRDEYLAARRKAFAKLDADGDGRLSFEEWATKATTKFATADRDRSGALDAAEFATTAVKRKPRPQTKCPPQQRPAETQDPSDEG